VYSGGKFEDEWAKRPYDFGAPFNLPNHPVVGLNWYEAVAFCAWLTHRLQLAGQLAAAEEISLPSESQWEKAARGPDAGIYPWGDEPDPEKANYADTGIGTTSAVGCFPQGASVYQVEEMSGNVWEWCRTKYEKSYDNYQDDNDLAGSPPRVWRGGAFYDRSGIVRGAARGRYDPVYRGRYGGFRVCVGGVPHPPLVSEPSDL
jgi:formylglycine-generating enzyme required for sulfatase activity